MYESAAVLAVTVKVEAARESDSSDSDSVPDSVAVAAISIKY